MKKLVSMALVLVLCFCFASSAFALTGTVKVSTWLNLRKEPKSNSTVIAYMKNGETVTILDEANKTNGFFHIRGYSYTNHDNWTGRAERTGYASASYID